MFKRPTSRDLFTSFASGVNAPLEYCSSLYEYNNQSVIALSVRSGHTERALCPGGWRLSAARRSAPPPLSGVRCGSVEALGAAGAVDAARAGGWGGGGSCGSRRSGGLGRWSQPGGRRRQHGEGGWWEILSGPVLRSARWRRTLPLRRERLRREEDTSTGESSHDHTEIRVGHCQPEDWRCVWESLFTFSHWADAFIQSDLQWKHQNQQKSNDKSQLA